MGMNYVLLAVVGRYLGRSAVAAGTGNKNLQSTYRIGQAVSRWVKLVFAWTLAILAAWYVTAMPGNPKLALGSEIVLVLILMPLLAYTAIAIVVPSMSESKYNGMSKMLRK
jgi:amino acid transporter